MDTHAELREFLHLRRARLRPEDAGFPTYGARRRVPGLRREELAQLAGISVDYYTRLEQGRLTNVSVDVLDAVGRALRLDATERDHLFNLAQPVPVDRRAASRPQRVRPGVQRLLDSLHSVPAFVIGPRLDVLAWNRLASALIANFDEMTPEQRNLCRFMFLDEDSKRLYVDWEEVARQDVAILRCYAGRHPDDRQLAALVGELSVKDERFRAWWGQHEVREKTHGRKQYHHPLVGELTVDYESIVLAGNPEQQLITYTVEPGSPSQEALSMLASWAAEPPPGRIPGQDAPRGSL
jgi:transcriptional regulator with XRE-family HTH domain